MSKSKYIKSWRKRTKERIVKSFGNVCVICGGKFPDEIYDLHHIDPNKKEFSLGNVRASSLAWEKIVAELRKCVLVCANCHRLLHYNYAVLPDSYNKFNEKYADYKVTHFTTLELCPICNKLTRKPHNITCSHNCAAKNRSKVDWDTVDVISMYREIGTYLGVAKELGVSDSAVRKRILKLTKR